MEIKTTNGLGMSQDDIDFLMVINKFDLLVKSELIREGNKDNVFPRYKDIVADIAYRNNLGIN